MTAEDTAIVTQYLNMKDEYREASCQREEGVDIPFDFDKYYHCRRAYFDIMNKEF